MNLNPAPERLGTPDGFDLVQARDAVKPSFGEYLRAQVGEGFWASTTGQALAQLDAAPRRGAPREAPLTAEEWRASPHFRESIPFDERITPTRARALAETFDANAYRRWIIDQRGAGIAEGTAGFVAGIVGSIPDPINFIPFAGPAFRAAQVARFGTIGGRAVVGAGEAALGTALAQPFLVTSRRQFGDDVTLADAMMDIALSAFAGAAIGGAAGVWTRATTRATPAARNAEPDLDVTPRAPEAIARDPIPDGPRQEAAMRVLSDAMRDMAEGRPIAIDSRWAGEFDGMRLSRARAQMDDLLATTAVGRTLDVTPDIRLGAEPDPRAIFREVAPELAARREEIETRLETQRRWLDELRVSGEARIREEFDAKIAALETRRESIDSAKRRAPLTKQIAALAAELPAAVARLASSDSPDMARVRQALLDDELKLRDMAPEISAAMREAERKAIARTPRIQSRVALVDAIERRRRLDFSTGADPDAALRAIETAPPPSPARPAAPRPAPSEPGGKSDGQTPAASPERRDLIQDTDALLADLEADPRYAEAAKAARDELARASGFDDAAGAAARCLKN
ncbi:MAG: hypothetical protein NBV67_02835 [Tagaea sp.]|nr:hypothetical protein [Tagaea sp.]